MATGVSQSSDGSQFKQNLISNEIKMMKKDSTTPPPCLAGQIRFSVWQFDNISNARGNIRREKSNIKIIWICKETRQTLKGYSSPGIFLNWPKMYSASQRNAVLYCVMSIFLYFWIWTLWFHGKVWKKASTSALTKPF